MNKILNYLKNQHLAFYLRIVSVILVLVPVIYSFTQIREEAPEYPYAILVMFLAAAVQIICIVGFVKNGIANSLICILGCILLGLALALFLCGGVLSLCDYFAHVTFWGHPAETPYIIGYAIVMFVGLVCAIVANFLKNEK